MGSASFLREAELALYNAPFDEGGWTGAIDRVRAAVGASTANLVGMGGPLLLPLTFWVGRNADEATRVSAAPELWGPCNWRVNSVGRPLDIQHDDHYAAYRKAADTSLYDDAMSDIDTMSGCQSAVMMGRNGFVGLALAWSKRSAGLDGGALDRFARLRLSLNRAIRMQLAIDGEAAELMLGDLQHMTAATILLDRHGNVSAMTRPAEDLFEPSGPLDLDGLAPRLRRRDEQRFLAGALSRILARDPADAPLHQMRIGRDAHHPAGRWSLFVMRLPARAHGLGFDPHVALTIKPLAATIAASDRSALAAN